MKRILALLFLGLSTNAWATTGTDKQIDAIFNSTGGSSIAVPSVGTTFTTDTDAQTLTNKTISAGVYSGGGSFAGTYTGTPTFSGAVILSGGPIISGAGTISSAVDFVDSSDATKKVALSLSGMTTGKTLTLSSTQSNNEVLSIPNVGSGDSFATLLSTQTFGSGSTWNGVAITVPFGGTGDSTLASHGVLVGAGTSAVSVTATGTSGQVLTSNGASADPTWQPAASSAPTINNSAASPQSVTAGGGITLTPPTYANVVFAKGGTPSANVTVTATPSITACTAAGQELKIISGSATATFTLQNNADLSGSQVLLNGPWTSGENNGSPYILNLICDGAGTPNWIEVSRNN